eukprot:TRINITY_DN13529_c0_g1_i3.p1 TRINITY_DN13529_c0_g1~~TRINITY_DN13529_c0_g1_i3.p1  ORF type:complete len:112 (-),score=0.73 TRINITY_DN13529_c0_g1_i3:342-677(-)
MGDRRVKSEWRSIFLVTGSPSKVQDTNPQSGDGLIWNVPYPSNGSSGSSSLATGAATQSVVCSWPQVSFSILFKIPARSTEPLVHSLSLVLASDWTLCPDCTADTRVLGDL